MHADRTSSADVAPGATASKLGEVRLADLAVRFALGATVSVAAGVLAKVVGARFGGTFLAFPAILPASLTLIQEKEGTRRAERNAIGAVLGGVALVVFAATGEFLLGHLPAAMAMLVMLAAWIATSLALYGLLAVLRPDDCDRNKD